MTGCMLGLADGSLRAALFQGPATEAPHATGRRDRRIVEFSLIGGGAFCTLHPLCELNGPRVKALSVGRRHVKR